VLLTGNEREHLASLAVHAERKRRAGEPGVAQVGQVRLRGQAERPERPAHRVADPQNPLSDAITDERLAFTRTAAPYSGSRL
jgi:hypothetical protein